MPHHGDSECVFRANGMRLFDGRFDLPAASGIAQGNYTIDATCKFNFPIATIEIAGVPISVA
jgi:hypothetical protein